MQCISTFDCRDQNSQTDSKCAPGNKECGLCDKLLWGYISVDKSEQVSFQDVKAVTLTLVFWIDYNRMGGMGSVLLRAGKIRLSMEVIQGLT